MGCGFQNCPRCLFNTSPKLASSSLYLFMPDMLLKHFSVFEQSTESSPFTPENTVFLQTSLETLQTTDKKFYTNLITYIQEKTYYIFKNENFEDTWIDWNTPDRVFEVYKRAAEFYTAHVPNLQVVIVTERKDSPRCRSLYDLLAGSMLHDLLPVTEPQGEVIYTPYIEATEAQKRVYTGELFEGVLHMYRNIPNKGWVTVNKFVEDRVEIGIEGRENLNRAIEGDIVAVYILPDTMQIEQDNNILQDAEDQVDVVETGLKDKVKTHTLQGQIVSVLKRKRKVLCGSIARTGKTLGNKELSIFSPINPRIPDIKIYNTSPDRLINKRISVVIDEWREDSELPVGHLIDILGDVEDIHTESKVILMEHDVIIKPFTEAALACLPPDNWTISTEELARRVDLRSVCVASVDPPGCKDIDDALHCRVLPNGNYEVGVHIADVSHFIDADSALDLEASERCTTVYLVERRTDMLPSILTERLCSLVSNEDRLAFSTSWEIDRNTYEILNTYYYKSVIRSRASLTYGKAQEIIDSKNQDELSNSLRNLLKISKILRQRRIQAGALELASAEVRFELDTDRLHSKDMALYKPYETNSMVEEFMLLANVSVARKIATHYPSYSILRRHPTPKEPELRKLSERLERQGFQLEYHSSRTLADSLNKVVRQNDPYFNKVIRMLVTRCMNQAVYFCSSEVDIPEYRHYGLAADIYTHFTSPIRRYADVLVHRLLAASLDIKSLPHRMTDRREMARICARMNFRHRMAQYAGRTSTSLHTYLVFKRQTTRSEEEAVVIDLVPDGLVVMVPKYGIEGVAEVEGEMSEMECEVRGEKIRLFDRVRVEIDISFKNYRKTIVLGYKSKLN